MNNAELINAYTTWLLGSDRSDATIRLRLRHIHHLAAAHELLTVTEDDLTAILAEQRHHAPETRKSLTGSWRLFFTWAHRRGHRPDNPTAQLKRIRIPAPSPRVAPDDDIRRALTTATPQQRAMILLARGGWMRLSEIAALHTSNRHDTELHIIGKGSKPRTIALNTEVATALDALEVVQGPGYYFPRTRNRGNLPHLHPVSVNKIITRATGWNPHSLRHAGATAAFRKTHDIRAVQAMLGHASLVTTQRYVHISLDELATVASASRLTPELTNA